MRSRWMACSLLSVFLLTVMAGGAMPVIAGDSEDRPEVDLLPDPTGLFALAEGEAEFRCERGRLSVEVEDTGLAGGTNVDVSLFDGATVDGVFKFSQNTNIVDLDNGPGVQLGVDLNENIADTVATGDDVVVQTTATTVFDDGTFTGADVVIVSGTFNPGCPLPAP